MTPTSVNDVPDFGNDEDSGAPVEFKIDGETFYASTEQPAGLLFDVASATKSKDLESQINMLGSFLEMMLVPESYERLKARMRDKTRPVTFKQVVRIMEWLMEQYAGRPTQQSSP
jgi:hypothetical protein